MEWLVRLLNFLDPHVQRIQLLFDKVIEVVGCIENTVDGAHQEREESQTQELEGNREDVLVRCGTRVVTVSDGCDDLEDPVKGKDVLGVLGL